MNSSFEDDAHWAWSPRSKKFPGGEGLPVWSLHLPPMSVWVSLQFPLKNVRYINNQSVLESFCFSVVLLFMIQHPVLLVLECASLDLDLVPWCCTAAQRIWGQMQGTHSSLHHVCVTHKVYCVIIASLKSHQVLNIQLQQNQNTSRPTLIWQTGEES